MDEILDEIEISHGKKIFSTLSFASSVITLVLFCFLVINIPKTIKASEELTEPPLMVVVVCQIFVLVGLAMMVLSFVKKEPSTWLKWVGGVLNILLFLVMAGTIIYSLVTDFLRG